MPRIRGGETEKALTKSFWFQRGSVTHAGRKREVGEVAKRTQSFGMERTSFRGGGGLGWGVGLGVGGVGGWGGGGGGGGVGGLGLGGGGWGSLSGQGRTRGMKESAPEFEENYWQGRLPVSS